MTLSTLINIDVIIWIQISLIEPTGRTLLRCLTIYSQLPLTFPTSSPLISQPVTPAHNPSSSPPMVSLPPHRLINPARTQTALLYSFLPDLLCSPASRALFVLLSGFFFVCSSRSLFLRFPGVGKTEHIQALWPLIWFQSPHLASAMTGVLISVS